MFINKESLQRCSVSTLVHWTSGYWKIQALFTRLYPKVTVTRKDCRDAKDGNAKYPQNTDWAPTTYTALC